jgi:hypothetical protein
MHSSNEYDIVCRYPAFEVRLNTFSGQQGLFSTESYNQGDTLIRFSIRSTQTSPTYLTVQIGESEHFEFEPDHLKYLNHSCHPNVFLDLRNHTLIAETAIESGDELRFFYPSTEWKMDQPFDCNCGADHCIGSVSGAHALSNAQLSNYKLSPYIQQKLTN